jgi:hypothetical protein
VPAKDRPAFLGRKHITTQNVLAIVDFDLRFTYVLAGWEGLAHDALILADAIQRPDGLKVPQGKKCNDLNAGHAPFFVNRWARGRGRPLKKKGDLCED